MSNNFPPFPPFPDVANFPDLTNPEQLQALNDSWKSFVDTHFAGIHAPTNPALTSNPDDDEPVTYSTALQTQEPDPDELHPDIDSTNVVNLSRLIALLQSGWILSRGKGPRNNDCCLWCRGPLTDHTQILVHDCGPNATSKCNNAWSASCFLQWVINNEIDKACTRIIRCPMCRGEIYAATRLKRDPRTQDFQHPTNEVVPAHVRVLLFGARLALQYAQEHGAGPLFFMERAEVAKLAMLGRNSVIFKAVDAIKHPARNEEHFVTLWLVVDWGYNEYRMAPYVSTPNVVPERLLGPPSPFQGTGFMTAQEVEHEAAANGGLANAVANFKPDWHDESIKEMVHGGKAELLMLIQQWVSSAGGDEQARERCKACFAQLTRAFGICMPPDEQTKSGAQQIGENQNQVAGQDQDGDVEMSHEDDEEEDEGEEEDEDEEEDSVQHTMETDIDEDDYSWSE
ncbi:hypothetical protein LTR67_003388 [Exophiala xenobiotica]